MRAPLLTGFLFLCFTALAQKTKDHTVVVAEIADKIRSANFGKVQVRLAVVTFVPIQNKANDPNTFGEYVTESIIGKISTNTDKFKLFERKRVDAILKENEFMLSGMIKANEAIKIGELLPIDALFSGTYTRLKNYVDVTARLIDVGSGEILMSYTGRVRLTKNIKTLFPEQGSESQTPTVVVASQPKGDGKPAAAKIDYEAMCKSRTEKFTAKLHDLSTGEKVDALVDEAIQTPFENVCGKLHYHFINALSRYNLRPARYERFLLATLDTIAYPSGDDRANSILSYLTKDRNVSEAEWNSGLATIRKVGDYTLSSYLSFMFNRVDVPDSTILQQRAEQYFALLNNGQIGLPRPVSFDKGFYEMMEALSANLPMRIYVYGRYGHRLETEPDNVVGLHLMYLKRMYDEETNPSRKTRIISWIADYFNNHVNKKSGDQLYDLARAFLPYPDDENSQFKIDQNKQAALKYPPHDLNVLIAKCGTRFAEYAVDTRYPTQKEDRVKFCARNGIPIPRVIPTIEEAKSILRGGDVPEQHRVMQLLVLMGRKVAPLETTFISLLDRRSIEHRQALSEVQIYAMQMLGTLRTKDKRAIAYMIASLKNYDKASDIAIESLVSIGKPSVSLLVEQLNATTIHDGGLQYRLITLLGRIGKDAREAAPAVRSVLAKTTNKDIRYAAEAALQIFGQ